MKEALTVLLLIIGVLAVRGALSLSRQIRLKKHWKRAQEALREEDLDSAAAALRRCISLMPLWVMARGTLGVILARQGKLDEAEEQLKLAAELQPRRPEGFVELGLFYALHCEGREDDAIGAFVNAAEHAPELAEQIRRDPRLKHLHAHSRFGEIAAAASG